MATATAKSCEVEAGTMEEPVKLVTGALLLVTGALLVVTRTLVVTSASLVVALLVTVESAAASGGKPEDVEALSLVVSVSGDVSIHADQLLLRFWAFFTEK